MTSFLGPRRDVCVTPVMELHERKTVRQSGIDQDRQKRLFDAVSR